MPNQAAKTRIMLFFWVSLTLALLIYTTVYILYPFEELVNDILLNTVYMVCVIAPPLVTTKALKFYEKREAPRRIWVYLSFGCWVWAAAELIWIVYNMILGDVPPVNLADPLYLAGYVTIIMAIVVQYRLVNRNSRFGEFAFNGLMWVIILLSSWFVFQFTGSLINPELQIIEKVGTFLAYVYSVSDLAICILALLVIYLFRSGALGKPWWGFFLLFLSDFFYAWLIQTDAYSYETWSGDILRLASDLIYILSYLVIAYGFLNHYFLLRFGPPETSTQPRRTADSSR